MGIMGQEVRGIPILNRIVKGATHETLSISRKLDSVNAVRMSTQLGNHLASRNVPDSNETIQTAPGYESTSRQNRNGSDTTFLNGCFALENSVISVISSQIPQPSSPIG